MVKRAFLLLIIVSFAWASGAISAASPATTHQVISAGNRYVPGDAQTAELPPLVIVQGDSLQHTNQDSELHNLLSDGFGPDGKRWFDSALVGQNQTASVDVEDVPPGVYGFTCSIHPFMRGRLQVEPPLTPSEPQDPPAEVSSGDNFFAPKNLTVSLGTTVRWTNNGQLNHSVTASDGSWDSSPGCPTTGDACLKPGQTFTHTFSQAGVVPYYCKLHGTPQGGGHAGTINVVDPVNTPTSVGSLSASRNGSTVFVSGSATFGGEPQQLLAEDVTGDSPGGPQSAQFGVDLATISIHRPDPAKSEVQFVWKVTQLDGEAPPEVVRYLWQMKLNEKEYWIQAKTTDFLSGQNVADDPAGHATHIQGAFKLRGNCGPLAGNVSTCRHVAWLTGAFDAAKDEVRVQVPLGNSAFPEFAPGNDVAPFGNVAAGFQVAVSNASTEDQVTQENPYRIAQKRVSFGIAPAGTPEADVSFGTAGTVGSGDSLSGSLNIGGLAPGSYDVWANACFGSNCGTRKTTITL